MRRVVFGSYVLVLFLSACMPKYNFEKSEYVAFIEKAALYISVNDGLDSYKHLAKDSIVGTTHVKDIYINKSGVYFRLGNSWGRESGIYVPRVRNDTISGPGYDPEYRQLADGIYQYIIK